MNWLPIAAAVAAAIFLGRVELHSDDTGVEVGLLLLFTFVLGCWQPRRAWLLSLIGLSAPIAELIWGPAVSQPLKHHLPLAVVVLLLGLAGSFSGAFARRLIKRPAQ